MPTEETSSQGGIPVCSPVIPGGETYSRCQIPRSCVLDSGNTIYVTVLNTGARDISFNVTFEVNGKFY